MLFDDFIENLKKLIKISNEIGRKPIWLIDEIKKYENIEPKDGGFYHEDGIDYMLFIDTNLTDLDVEIEARIYYCQKIKDFYTEIYDFLLS
ncbi:MAG: hypothetical protein NZZ41_07965 [Candidatus Dojkabacteria bacterium]|nr:hypothetical protein [Candidatus Dojkabacteria bacterium]